MCRLFFFFFVITLSCYFSCVWARLTSRNRLIMEAAQLKSGNQTHIFTVSGAETER